MVFSSSIFFCTFLLLYLFFESLVRMIRFYNDMIHSLFIPMALKGGLFCGQQGDENDDALLNTVDLTQKAPSGKN